MNLKEPLCAGCLYKRVVPGAGAYCESCAAEIVLTLGGQWLRSGLEQVKSNDGEKHEKDNQETKGTCN